MLLNRIVCFDSFFREKAFQICGNKFEADDLVQEMYLKLHNYNQIKLEEMIDRGVAKFVAVRILKQLKIDNHRKAKKVEDDYTFIHHSEEYQELNLEITELFNELYWFDRDLFKFYVEDDYSIRSLSKETGISTNKIYQTINKVKEQIKEKCKERNIPLKINPKN